MKAENHLNLFFDESFKNKGIDMMGAICIPVKVYNSSNIQRLNKRIRSDKMFLHWTEYNGDNTKKNDILDTLKTISIYYSLFNINIIFKDNKDNASYYSKLEIKEMMFFKFPERIFYGLLRIYSKETELNPKIYVEDATEYHSEAINLKENTIKNLNNLAKYRGLRFKLKDEDFVFVDASKKKNNSLEEIQKAENREIGIYVIDLILGIVRTIMENHTGESKKQKAKNDLVIDLLQDSNFYKMIENIKLFHWSGSQNLEQVDMQSYLQIFLSNREKWLEYLVKK